VGKNKKCLHNPYRLMEFTVMTPSVDVSSVEDKVIYTGGEAPYKVKMPRLFIGKK
jgi:hypothetical protein